MSEKFTTIKKELKKLKSNETLCIVREESGGYFIGVADNVTAQDLTITEQELRSLVRLGCHHLGLEIVEKGI